MSVIIYPSVGSYWNTTTGFKQIKDTMSLTFFENICSVIHFNNNSNEN